jgi:hypothetical protein
LLVTWACAACSAGPTLQLAGGQCLFVADCQLGLVCVKNRCSSDLSGIVNTEDAAAAGPPAPTAFIDGGSGADVPVAPFGDAGGDAAVNGSPQDAAAQE